MRSEGKIWLVEGQYETLAVVHCPGCNIGHPFRVKSNNANRPSWTWNGDMHKPTFTPSMLVNGHDESSRCHSFVTDGKIQFLGDCFHDLKNTTVDLPDLDYAGDPIKGSGQ